MNTKTFEVSEELIMKAIITLLYDGEKVTETNIRKSLNVAIQNVLNCPDLNPYSTYLADDLFERDGIDYSDIKVIYQKLLMAKRNKQFKKLFISDSPTFAS